MEWNTWNWNAESIDRSTALSLEIMESLNCFVLGDQVLWLNRQWSVGLSRFGGCFESKDVLFEEALLDKLF